MATNSQILEIANGDTFRDLYAKLVAIASSDADEHAVGQELISLEQRLRAGNTPKVLLEAEDGVSPVHSLISLYQRLRSDAFTGRVSGEEREINPDWQDNWQQHMTSEWRQMGGGRERWGAGGRCIRTAYHVVESEEQAILTTEPYQLANAHWPEAQGRAQNGFYIRNKHTGEVLARIEQGGGWSWDTEYKYLDAEGNPRGGTCHLLPGTFLDFFHNLEDTDYILLNGTIPPIVHGTLFKKDSSAEAGRVYELCGQHNVSGFSITFPTPGWRDFQPITRYPTYQVVWHNGYGVEVNDYNGYTQYHGADIINALAGDPSNLKLVAGNAGPGEDFGGKTFSWNFFRRKKK
jgi:hypothetical protein